MNTKAIEKSTEHNIIMKNRAQIRIEGITDVISFDEELVDAITEYGALSIEGEELHVALLDTEGGCLALTGRISGIYYNDKTPKRRTGLFGAKAK